MLIKDDFTLSKNDLMTPYALLCVCPAPGGSGVLVPARRVRRIKRAVAVEDRAECWYRLIERGVAPCRPLALSPPVNARGRPVPWKTVAECEDRV